MATVILLKNNDITVNTNLGGNIDPNRYLHCIRDAQKTELMPLIGKDLYKKIMADFSGNTLTGVYQELYDDYIKDFVIHKAGELYLAIGAYMVSDAGITKTSTDNTETVSKDEIDYMVVHQRNLAKHYGRQMKKFLNENKDDIPEYQSDGCCSNRGGSNIMGFYLPNTYKRRNY